MKNLRESGSSIGDLWTIWKYRQLLNHNIPLCLTWKLKEQIQSDIQIDLGVWICLQVFTIVTLFFPRLLSLYTIKFVSQLWAQDGTFWAQINIFCVHRSFVLLRNYLWFIVRKQKSFICLCVFCDSHKGTIALTSVTRFCSFVLSPHRGLWSVDFSCTQISHANSFSQKTGAYVISRSLAMIALCLIIISSQNYNLCVQIIFLCAQTVPHHALQHWGTDIIPYMYIHPGRMSNFPLVRH